MRLILEVLLISILVGWIGASVSLNLRNTDGNTRKTWALLVAGSKDWKNYRHQADVAHAYHVLRDHGILAGNIITMMYDDIANNSENPYPGKIFNSPNGKDVYKGVKIDYKGDDVNPENFLAVLSGNSKGVVGGNSRVIQSTENDKIFVYFSDHGGPGVVVFPRDELTVKQLMDTFKRMHKERRYAEMTFYLEACFSGSMFEKVLPNDMNIYAMTAANSHETSKAAYMNTTIHTYLGDRFSVSWMEDSEKSNLNKETLKEQYEKVQKLTDESHVCHFGSEKILNEYVSEYQGSKKTETNVEEDDIYDYAKWQTDTNDEYDTDDIPLFYLMSKRDRETDVSVKAHLDEQINTMQKKRRYLENQIIAIVEKLVADDNGRKRVMEVFPERLHENLDCHNDVVTAFSRKCFNLGINTYALKYVYVLANLCEMDLETDQIVNAVVDHCKRLPEIVGDIV